jgi:signal transduction histidine kinase
MLQALIDITENALEALVNEKGERKIEYAASEITGDGKKYIKLSISDNGVGIDPKDMDYIFEPFFTKRKKEGVGLGLPNVKRIVDAHNGQVQVRSRKGRGTTFEITIPVDFSKKR